MSDFDDTDAQEAAALLKALSADPNTRRDLLKLLKKHKPDLAVPELEIEDQVSQQTKGIEEKLAKFEEDQMRRDAEQRLNDARGKVMADYRLTQDDLAAIEKMMTEQRIGSHDAAARLFVAERQLAAPTHDLYPAEQPIVSEDFLKNPRAASRKVANDVINEIARNRRH